MKRLNDEECAIVMQALTESESRYLEKAATAETDEMRKGYRERFQRVRKLLADMTHQDIFVGRISG